MWCGDSGRNKRAKFFNFPTDKRFYTTTAKPKAENIFTRDRRCHPPTKEQYTKVLALLSVVVCHAEPAIPSGKRTQYLVQDHAGKGTYKFGYDTGEGAQQQNFRQEERTSDGTVRGRYGFTDANGYLRVIEYIADETGYHVIHAKTELPQNRPRSTVKPHAPFLGPLPPFIPRPQPEEEET
ncbi:adult-specific rigid cuticular protein 15.7-like isoform X2 [Dermacentor albipictus]|uniref:adult-specific rigid cuticular protein 15.7-like isoform X2 n=1 Tax=Dermacentor albipictus TaxID=60249 RepID=UPI0031FE2FBE